MVRAVCSNSWGLFSETINRSPTCTEDEEGYRNQKQSSVLLCLPLKLSSLSIFLSSSLLRASFLFSWFSSEALSPWEFSSPRRFEGLLPLILGLGRNTTHCCYFLCWEEYCDSLLWCWVKYSASSMGSCRVQWFNRRRDTKKYHFLMVFHFKLEEQRGIGGETRDLYYNRCVIIYVDQLYLTSM